MKLTWSLHAAGSELLNLNSKLHTHLFLVLQYPTEIIHYLTVFSKRHIDARLYSEDILQISPSDAEEGTLHGYPFLRYRTSGDGTIGLI